MKNELIQYVPIFAGLSDEERDALASAFVEGQCAAHATLLKAGERGEAIYLIGQGFVALTSAAGQSLATLGPGSILGEASLFHGAPLDFTAMAVSDLSFWKLSDRRLRELILQQPTIGIRLSENFGSLIAQMQDYLIQRLANTQELGALPQHTLEAVARRLQPHRLPAGETLYHAGEPARGLYVVESGALELVPEAGMPEEGRQVLRSGTVVGALALLTGKPYAQTATAVQESRLWLLPVEDFQAISSQHPGLRRALSRNLRARLSKADQAEAVRRLARMPLFTEVPPQIMQAVAQRLVLQHVPAGERVYMMGEAGDALYLVESGEIELTAENASGVVEELARIGAGGFFGEMGVLTGQIRAEDATAIRNTNLWVLYRADLDELSSQHSAISKALNQGLASRLATHEEEDDEERFRRFALLSELTPVELRQVVEFLRPMRYRSGELIYRASSPADTLFLLEKGQVRIQPFSGGSWLLGPGETFGERALLTNHPPNASAMAETDVDVWTLSKTDFDMLMNRYPSLAISMSRMLSQRLTPIGPEPAAEAREGGYVPSVTAIATNIPAARRRPAPVGGQVPPPPERTSFGQWFSSLSTFAKVRLALLILLLIWLLLIAAPYALAQLLQGTSMASGASLSSTNLLDAIEAVYAVGSYELAQRDEQMAQVIAMADRQVAPTATYTPPPTNTPIPTPTPTATNTPRPTPTVTATPSQVIVQGVAPPPEPTPEPEIQAASLPARAFFNTSS